MKLSHRLRGRRWEGGASSLGLTALRKRAIETLRLACNQTIAQSRFAKQLAAETESGE